MRYEFRRTALRCLGFVIVLLAAGVSFSQSSPRAEAAQPELWLTVDKYAYLLSEKSGGEIRKVEVGENAYYTATSPDGKLVAVVSFGLLDQNIPVMGPLSGRTEWWPKKGSGSFVTFIKREGNEIVGHYPVRHRPKFIAFTPDGATLIVASLGQFSRSDEKNLSPQIALIDVATGKVRNPADGAYWTGEYWYNASTNRLMIGWAASLKGKYQRELVSYDTHSGAVERAPLPSEPGLWRDSGYDNVRYLVCENSIVVVDSNGKLTAEPLSPGKENMMFVREPRGNRYFLAGKVDKKQGKVMVIDGGKISKEIEVRPLEFIFFDKEGSRIFLCPDKEAIVLDLKTYNELTRLPLPGRLYEGTLSPDEKRVYALEYGGKVSVIDVEAKKEIGSFTSGRGGVKFGIMLANGLANAMSGIQASYTGYPGNYYPLPLQIQTIAFSASGDFVYVYNSFSSDVTVVNAKTFLTLAKEPTGHTFQDSPLWQMPDKRYLLSAAPNKVMVFDAEKGEAVIKRELPRSSVQFDPDSGLVFVCSDTGTEVYRPTPFEKLKDLPPGKKVIPQPEAKRFLVVSNTKLSLYDYDFKLMHEIEGKFDPKDITSDNLHAVSSVSIASQSRR
jgi:DNA-binding beta-propeller fold protein YncE